ncbi:hypothetical protein ANN_12621 [Periplaneta americana]|uniref:RRM domain-containing protein n=1 Tax=Periplaneta americana TaxID=6978 RepID=A0ABQ8TJT1_PERAM|nr:hypothetical protein ANN_12621 [Periplaneta americana]
MYQGEIEFQYESGEITHVNIGPPDSASVTVRVFNLPPEIPSSVLQTVLNKYGTIQDIRNETWSTQYLLPVYNGVKAVRMNIQKSIPATIQCITNVHETMDTNTNAPSISSTPPTEALIRCKRPIPPSESSSSNPTAHIDSLSEVSSYNTDGETTANPKNHSKLNPPRKKSKKVKPPALDEQLHPVKTHIRSDTE